MKKIIALIVCFFCLKALATDFRTFEDYKNNNALLASDIERLEVNNHKSFFPLYAETLVKMRFILDNYDLLNTELKLKMFAVDALDSGWKQTSIKANALAEICEGSELNYSQCINELKDLKQFVLTSDLNAENKQIISSFLEEYTMSVSKLLAFDKDFITQFNQDSKNINVKLSETSVPVAPIVVKISPPTKVVAVPRVFVVEKSWFQFDNHFVLFALSLTLLSGASAYAFSKRKKKSKIESFYAQLFRIGHKNKFKLRIFGTLDLNSYLKVKTIEPKYIEAIKMVKDLSPEVHIKFKKSKTTLKIESVYLSNASINEYVKQSGESINAHMQTLGQQVSELGGEIFFCNNIDTKGEITQSSLTIHLPIS